MRSSLPYTIPCKVSQLSSWQASASRADTANDITTISTSRSSIRHHLSHIDVDSLGKLSTESLRLSKLAWATERSQAVVSVASLLAFGECLCLLGDKGTALNRVDEGVSGWESVVVGPGSRVSGVASSWELVVFWEDVDEADFADLVTLGVTS